ncbi:MAG: hypothetical protein JO063_12360 [Pseudonocardiales bacterium]|nr:hypothetical protein [Pseudonocardiales bacterium]MBV9029013.1 hypothetical protein [Pseudonocardiales bacterium]MBW0010884.1 hypothetical protein [Pseudonocardiales bacterium]
MQSAVPFSGGGALVRLAHARAAALDLVDAIRLGEDVERLLHLVLDDAATVDVEAREERLVQDRTHGLVPALVGRLRRLQQGKGAGEHLSASVEVALGLVECVFDLLALVPDGVDLGP